MIVLTKGNRLLLEELKRYNPETYYHSLRVKTLVKSFLELLMSEGFVSYSQAEIDYILTGAILHDVGKVFVRNYVLTKKSKLTEEEKNNILLHTQKGTEEVCKELTDRQREIVKNICLYHHERLDGKGYYGKSSIPDYVQIVSLCDAYDALVSDRVYRAGMLPEEAISLIENGKCGCFSKELTVYLRRLITKEQVKK